MMETTHFTMKNEIYRVILFIAIFLVSCNPDTKNTARRNDDKYRNVNNREQCFVAIYQKDSAVLKFETMPDGKIRGNLIIKYSGLEPLALEREFYRGEIKGQFTKDTLFADYLFTDGKRRTVYCNPIVLLKKGNKLVLGFGAIETYLGRSYFRNHRAINFIRSRFQFVPAECNNYFFSCRTSSPGRRTV